MHTDLFISVSAFDLTSQAGSSSVLITMGGGTGGGGVMGGEEEVERELGECHGSGSLEHEREVEGQGRNS